MASTGVRYQVSNIAWQVPVSDICVKYSMTSTGAGYHVSNIAWQVPVSGIMCQI